MESALKANSKDIAEQYEHLPCDLPEAYGEAMLELKFREKATGPSRLDRRLVRRVIDEMAEDVGRVPVAQGCEWAGISRRGFYYKGSGYLPKINDHLAARVMLEIETLPYAGYRTTARPESRRTEPLTGRWKASKAKKW